jgi:hypothetical protein
LGKRRKNFNQIQGSIKVDSVMILPKNYGYGARWMEDKVWGIFKADDQTKQIWNRIQTSLNMHGLEINNIYFDSNFPLPIQYQNVYSYNG